MQDMAAPPTTAQVLPLQNRVKETSDMYPESHW